jgi:hypothetical protein
MAEAVYILCMLASLACAAMLFRGYRQSRVRFLLWGSLCFAAFMVNNLLLFIDLAILSDEINLILWRDATALVGLSLLLFGLIWDAE